MRIGYDAKRLFHNHTGLGNYSRDLLKILSQFYPKNKYLLYNPKRTKRIVDLSSNTSEIFPKEKFWKFFSSIWRQKAITKQLINDKIDIYHGLSGELPRGINKTKIKTVVTIHDLIFVRYPKLYSFFDRKIHFNKFKYAAKTADVVVAISEQTKRDIINFLGISATKIVVLYQGCNHEFKKEFTAKEKKEVLSKYNLPKQYILNVGTVEERKNLLSVVKAIKSSTINLVVVGKDNSSYAQVVKKYIKENNLQDNVQFLKNVNITELAIIYQLASVFVYPSIFEGFGIPIIEALYSKTPVITSKGGCFIEAGGSNSKYIDALDSKEMAKQINAILNNEDLSKSMINKGYEFVQKFKNELLAKNMYNLYKKLI
ncbi:MAG: glycosyltransferase family 4 protein [Flavobacteriaceae bacterium]|nr:glycosyltransferase family 4 protein [Flavobacteriaceae bacterium]